MASVCPCRQFSWYYLQICSLCTFPHIGFSEGSKPRGDGLCKLEMQITNADIVAACNKRGTSEAFSKSPKCIRSKKEKQTITQQPSMHATSKATACLDIEGREKEKFRFFRKPLDTLKGALFNPFHFWN